MIRTYLSSAPLGRFFFIILFAGLVSISLPGSWGCGGGSDGEGDDDSADDDGDDDDDGEESAFYPGGAPDSTTITFESSSLAAGESLSLPDPAGALTVKAQEEDETIASCTVVVPGENGGEFDGSCMTPINITGAASAVAVGQDDDTSMDGPARLLGSTVGSISLDRLGELEVSPFDFADPVGMPGNSNVSDFEERTYDLLRVDLAYMDVQIEVPRPGDTFEYWTVRWAFITNPVSDAVMDNDETISDCVDAFYGASVEANGILTGLKDFQAGDRLVCQRDSPDEACAEDDFLWFDQDTDSFVATRPDNPLQHEWANVPDRRCEEGNPGYDIQLGSYDFFATINNPFTLSSENEECLQVYTDGDGNTGNTLDVTIDFDLGGAIFVNGLDGDDAIAAASEGAVLEAMKLKQIFIRAAQPDPSIITDDVSGDMTVDVTVSITDDETLSCPSLDEIDGRLVADADNPCTPDSEVDLDCDHTICTGFTAVDEAGGNIWSENDSGGCPEYCAIQTCDSYNGTFKAIHCVPDCEEEGGDDDDGEGDDEGGEGPEGGPESCEDCIDICLEQGEADTEAACEDLCNEEFDGICQ